LLLKISFTVNILQVHPITEQWMQCFMYKKEHAENWSAIFVWKFRKEKPKFSPVQNITLFVWNAPNKNYGHAQFVGKATGNFL
jgi:hypothetical protein